MNETLISSLQGALRQEKLDGWLFYSFRGSDPIAANILGLDQAQFATRRWFYYVPASGTPRRIVHAIEAGMLDALPGDKHIYLPWQQLHAHVKQALQGSRRVAMQYSPMNAIPYVSRVDAGTVEMVRSFGIEVVSSADLVQMFEAVWSDEQLDSHRYASRHMHEIVEATFREVARRVRENAPATELDIQDFIWSEFDRRDLTAGHRPIVAINEHSADPHYSPDAERNLPMRENDFLLIDLWSKKKQTHAVYFDITWTAFIGRTVPDEHTNIFNVVRGGRDAAIEFVRQQYPGNNALCGWQVDDTARDSIRQAGYGDFFIHRTGHSIHEEVHGNGSNIDNLETQDNRRLMARTCFSIEPGVYLPNRFGVRSEIDMYLSETEATVTGPLQTQVVAILDR